MIAEAAKGMDEAQLKKMFSTTHWIDDLPFEQALERLVSQPTVNIEGWDGAVMSYVRYLYELSR